jgi:hypothetical protein
VVRQLDGKEGKKESGIGDKIEREDKKPEISLMFAS